MNYEKNKDEFYEEMERDDTEENIINSEKKPKKRFSSKFIKIGVVSLISILFIIYLISKYYYNIKNNLEFSEKRKNLSNSSEIKLKLNFTFEYNETNKIEVTKSILGEPEKRIFSRTDKYIFGIGALSQFPSGNFIVYNNDFIVIYDKFFNVLQTISPFADEFGKYTINDLFYEIIKILIKDENNFIILTNYVCNDYGNLLFYKKEGKNYILKNEVKNEKLVSDIIFDKSKTKLFCISHGFIKVFKEDENGYYSKIKEINVPEFHSLSNNNGGYYNKMLLLEDKNVLIVMEQEKLSFLNISENYKLYKVYKENSKNHSDIFSIDRYDEDKIIAICNLRSLKVISINENKVIKYIKEINEEKDFEFRILKTYPEKKIIILGGTYSTPKTCLGAIIQILRLDNFEIIQTIKLPEYEWLNEIYILDNGLIATIFTSGVKLWSI